MDLAGQIGPLQILALFLASLAFAECKGWPKCNYDEHNLYDACKIDPG